uniref:Glutathione S-transferase parA n=1 Tax=Nelumbo nucifera TaxID=4432 RepID=A0A822Z615_NELNU|nr:TPA_asm: hypothetical protein HUJ06_009077 [Nelumbo nucifera]
MEEETAKKEIIRSLKVLQGYLVPFYSWFYSTETCGNFSIESECPKIVAWGKRYMERESVYETLPHHHKIYEFVLQLKKRLGIE